VEARTVVVIGVDPGIRNSGLVVCEADWEAAGSLGDGSVHTALKPVAARVICTSPTKNKHIRKCDDKAYRIVEILREIQVTVAPFILGAPAVFVGYETFNLGGRGHRVNLAGTTTSYVIGAILAWCSIQHFLYVPVHPAQSKGLMTGLKSSSKEQVYATRQRELEAVAVGKLWPKGRNEHVGDALAVCAATLVHARSKFVITV